MSNNSATKRAKEYRDNIEFIFKDSYIFAMDFASVGAIFNYTLDKKFIIFVISDHNQHIYFRTKRNTIDNVEYDIEKVLYFIMIFLIIDAPLEKVIKDMGWTTLDSNTRILENECNSLSKHTFEKFMISKDYKY